MDKSVPRTQTEELVFVSKYTVLVCNVNGAFCKM